MFIAVPFAVFDSNQYRIRRLSLAPPFRSARARYSFIYKNLLVEWRRQRGDIDSMGAWDCICSPFCFACRFNAATADINFLLVAFQKKLCDNLVKLAKSY